MPARGPDVAAMGAHTLDCGWVRSAPDFMVPKPREYQRLAPTWLAH